VWKVPSLEPSWTKIEMRATVFDDRLGSQRAIITCKLVVVIKKASEAATAWLF